MKIWQKLGWLVSLLALCELPANANNPPQPDGTLSIFLIFPAVILGARLAGAAPIQKSRGKRIATGIVLGFCAFVTAGGTEVALIPLLLILAYGILRGGQILRLGQGRKRYFLGGAVMAFTVFAVVDYFAALVYYPSSAAYESSAESGIRTLCSAESEFIEPTYSHRPASPVYGTIEDLKKAQLLDDTFASGPLRRGYRFGEIVDPAKKQFLVYAIPAAELKPATNSVMVVPGGSLLKAILPQLRIKGTGRKGFAADETGMIRFAVRTSTGPVTREEIQQWQPVQ